MNTNAVTDIGIGLFLIILVEMKLIFATEARFVRDKEGRVYGDPAFGPMLWRRYLEVFEHVCVLCRMQETETYSGNLSLIPADAEVVFFGICHYVGMLDYVAKRSQVVRDIRRHLEQNADGRFLCRLPGNVGSLVVQELNCAGLNYAVEVVGDPDEVFSKGSFNHPLRRLLKFYLSRQLRLNVERAAAVLYVTTNVLQGKYPANGSAFVTYASNVSLDESRVAAVPKNWKSSWAELNLLSIGSLDQMYKAPDIALEGVKLLLERLPQIKVNFTWLGDGAFRESMIEYAKELGMSHCVRFLGSVDRTAIYDHLNNADIFFLVSRTEGLPRVVIEAMSVGLPIIGTNVGGMPELLDNAVIIEKNSPTQLAEGIERLIVDERFYNAQAERNLLVAQDYRESILRIRRERFYDYIKTSL